MTVLVGRVIAPKTLSRWSVACGRNHLPDSTILEVLLPNLRLSPGTRSYDARSEGHVKIFRTQYNAQ